MITNILNKRAVIKHRVHTPDGTGGADYEWQEVATVWAGFRPISGRERFQFMHYGQEIDTRIIIRYRDDVDSRCRIEHGGLIYEVKAVLNPGLKNEWLEILAVTHDG